MIFDQLATYVETSRGVASPMFTTLERARLFVVPQQVSERKLMCEDAFHLPFPTVAIEMEGHSLMLLEQRSDDMKAHSPFWFIVDFFGHLKKLERAFSDTLSEDAVRTCNELASLQSLMLCKGQYRMEFSKEGYQAFCLFNPAIRPIIFRRGESIGEIDISDSDLRWFLKWVTCIVQHNLVTIATLSDRTQFLLEESPVGPRRQRQEIHRRILRSQDRPRYTILRAPEIRRKLSLPNPEANGSHKSPHERAGHLRHYRSDRFVNMKGKKVWIEATWIGPYEATIGSRRYKVVLESRQQSATVSVGAPDITSSGKLAAKQLEGVGAT